jgi:subtilase family serine protease
MTLIVGLAALAFGANPEPQRIESNGLMLEIRYEPIPGVPLHPAEVARLPVEIAPAECTPVTTEPQVLAAENVQPIGAVRNSECGMRSSPLRTEQCTRTGPAWAAECGQAHAPETQPASVERMRDAPESASDGLPNLFFYRPLSPDTWDFPIVPANVRGTYHVGPDLNDGDTTYFDFAVGNNGQATARPRFYTYLYSDGSVFAGFYTESLPAGYYTYYNDYPRKMISGAHLIAGFTDSTNVIAESLETDNRWSHSWTWRSAGGALPNLRPYKPTGWDFEIVPSDVPGTHTVGPDLNDFDPTFVDWAILNDGNATAKPRFYTYLYLDNRPVAGWYIDSLPYMWYTYAEDDTEFVTAGTHSLGTFADSFNVVVESNENDNRYSHSWTWRHDAATLPNLTWYQPSGWPWPIIPSSARGTRIVGPNLNDRDTTFIDYCWANLGTWVAQPRFYVYLYWETTPISGWYMDSLPATTYVYVEDDAFILPAGTHALGMVVDSTNTVLESNEGDNHFSHGFTWAHVAIPDLVPYAPTGWDYPIVPSNVRNTHTTGPDLNDRDSTFLDWAVANQGGATAKPRFYTYLYLDNAPFVGFYVDSLLPQFWAGFSDYARVISSGTHNLMSYADSFNAVAESLENNNRYSRAFDWRHVLPGQPDLAPYAPVGWDYPIVPSNVPATHLVGPDLNDRDSTYLDWCIINQSSVVAKPRFYTFLYLDNVPIAGFYVDSLPAQWIASVSDFTRMIASGTHNLMSYADSFNAVAESLENNNRYSRAFDWRAAPALPNLTFYTPSGWDFPVVPSSVRNTHTVGPDLNDYDTTFVDFAFVNNGSATARPRFYTYLYEDQVAWIGFYLDSLPAYYYASALDAPRLFVAGDHELGMFIDSTNSVAESLENDNRWFHTFHWTTHTGISERGHPSEGCPLSLPDPWPLTLARNPIFDRAELSYELTTGDRIRLSVYDVSGKLRAELAQGERRPGVYRVDWSFAGLACGTYLVVLETASGKRRVATLVKL